MKDWNENGNSIYMTLGASNHTDKERQIDDYYATDEIAIDKLLNKFEIPKNILECSAGGGNLSKRLIELGHNVLSYDIIERTYQLDKIIDFFNVKEIPKNYSILTNPPYKYAKEFVLHALELIEKDNYVIMFLKTTFLEGKNRFKQLFSKYPPKNVFVSSERILCAKNGEFEKMKKGGGSAVSYSWFVWQKDYVGKTIVDWI